MLVFSSFNTARIVSGPTEVQRRLAELHPALTPGLFQDVNAAGLRARLEATPAHAVTAAGTYHWHAAVHAKRTLLSELGWSSWDHKNCPLSVSPDRTISLMAMTGSKETGLEGVGSPTNQADKGPVLDEAVRRNAQLEMFDGAKMQDYMRTNGATQIWVFLYAMVNVGGEMMLRSELSLPSRFHGKKIVEWSERILFEPMSGSPGPVKIEIDPFDPVDIDVQRRAG